MKQHRIIRTKGQRIAFTSSAPVPAAELVAAIKFVAAEIDLDRTVIHFKRKHDGWNLGYAYSSIPAIANLDGLKRHEWRYLVVVRLAGTTISPRELNTLGHEAKHVEQFRRGTLRREKRARNCEAQARAFGAWISARWVEATA